MIVYYIIQCYSDHTGFLCNGGNIFVKQNKKTTGADNQT